MVLKVLEEISEGCKTTGKCPREAMLIFMDHKNKYIGQMKIKDTDPDYKRISDEGNNHALSYVRDYIWFGE